MGFFADRAEVDIVALSGVVRVSVRRQPTLPSLLVTAAILIDLALISLLTWRQSALPERIGEMVVVFSGAFYWFQLLSGSGEEIEIDAQGIRIDRQILGWNRISEFPIEQCRDLDLQADNEDSRQLQVRFGRLRTIKFGDYMSREQAEKVLDILADSLPEVAQQLLPHATSLNAGLP